MPFAPLQSVISVLLVEDNPSDARLLREAVNEGTRTEDPPNTCRKLSGQL